METRINKAINDFEEFLDADLPSKIFPHDEVLKKVKCEDWYRQDTFESKEEVRKYIAGHFDVFRKVCQELLKKYQNKNEKVWPCLICGEDTDKNEMCKCMRYMRDLKEWKKQELLSVLVPL